MCVHATLVHKNGEVRLLEGVEQSSCVLVTVLLYEDSAVVSIAQDMLFLYMQVFFRTLSPTGLRLDLNFVLYWDIF